MYSFVSYLGTGAQTDFAIPFPYLSQSHVEASLNGVPATITFPTSGTARFSPAPGAGVLVAIRRNSSRAERLVDFATSSVVTEANLDTDSLQAFYLAQEALDQASSESYFSTDAQGSRVTNMADPVNDTDGVNKQYLVSYITALGLGGGGGLDLRPLNNTWTGTNYFDNTVSIKGAVFDGAEVGTREMLKVNKALGVYNTSSSPTEIGYGFATQSRRSSGYGLVVGAQLNSMGLGSWTGTVFGTATEAWRGRDSLGTIVGLETSTINLNPSETEWKRVGLDVVFKNREDGAAVGGQALNILGIAGYGSGANYYNSRSWGIQISAQDRSDSGASYCGWGTGIKFVDKWGDLSRLVPYSASVSYTPGDQVYYGSKGWQCKEPVIGAAPVTGTYWAEIPLDGTGLRKAIGIDLSTFGSTTFGRMRAGMKLYGALPILWDTEEQIATKFDPATGRWSIWNNTFERWSMDAPTGDVLINGVRRLQATRSDVSVHRNGSVQTVTSGYTKVTFSTEERDARGEYASSRFTPNTPGLYLVTAQLENDTGSPGGERMVASIFKNGALHKSGGMLTTAAKTSSANVQALVQMNGTTDYLELYCYWSGGSAGYISGEATGTFFQATKLS